MLIERSSLPAVLILTPDRFEDKRGYFSETWNRKTLVDAGVDLDFVQDNQSFSAQVGTVRGLHFQAPPHAQDKLVRCSQGAIFDVALDIRCGSPTYGHWVGVELNAANGRQLLIPKGFLHGFVTREPASVVQYRCTDYYSPTQEGAVVFDDPDLGVDWLLSGEPILSPRDSSAPCFADVESPFSWTGPLPWED
ncbi:dTDP-4-dehydrorhamnose 3,5-epimerase [Shimia abyssi]|nr:dTDP-4-dehydrorhamnose 3,5-epimerase [Shimia abyssi]